MLCGRRCSASQLVSSRLLIFHHPPEIQGYAAPALHSHTRVTAASRTRTCAQPCHRLRLHDSTHLWSQSPQAAQMTRNRRGRSLSISGSIRRGGSSKSYSQLSRTEQSKMCKREMEWSKVSKVTSHTVAATAVVTHPPPFSKHRDRDPPSPSRRLVGLTPHITFTTFAARRFQKPAHA